MKSICFLNAEVTRNLVSTLIVAVLLTSVSYAQVVFDFDDKKQFNEWEAVDDVSLGDAGPSTWEVRKSVGLDKSALYQGSNIWGDASDSMLMGTFIIYKGEKFIDFVIEVDVFAQDNDGMGLVWAYEDTGQHYRVIMINDKWPDPAPLDKIGGPFLKIDKRIGDKNPWYDPVAVEKKGYKPYLERQRLHWKLEVSDGAFVFTREDGLSIEGKDDAYKEGYVGIQLYAQQAEFDNFTITNTFPVDARDRLTTTWGQVKRERR